MMDATHILLVEDNDRILLANRRLLEIHGYRISMATTLAHAEAAVRTDKPDLIVLDIMLPDGSGLDFCEKLRAHGNLPILFLTALSGKDQVVEGLRRGGDDYLAKPYHYGELLARIDALLRRTGAQPPAQATSSPIRLGPIQLDPAGRRAYVNGQDLLLTPKEFALLALLNEHRGTLLSTEYIYETVWALDPNSDARTVYVHITGLRKKLATVQGSELRIEQVRGQGYRLLP